jgi:uncharacterized integral membrane protein
MKNDKIDKAATQHNISQKSQAIYQRAIKQPVSQIGPFVRKVGHNMDIARSKSIAHFVPHTATAPITQKTAQKKSFDIGPSKHPLTVKAEKKTQPPKVAQASVALPTSKAIKEQMIAEAFSQLSEGQQAEKEAMKHKFRVINIIIAIIIIVFIVIYFIIINLPAISVSVASAQAGISATYPSYQPDGYSLNGNIAYTDGQVAMNFRANTGDKKFSINQIKSSWDSSALRDQVNKDSNGVFTTTAESGLTIYTYGSTTTWVNGGILYTITGNAPLSSIQIRHIATSL